MSKSAAKKPAQTQSHFKEAGIIDNTKLVAFLYSAAAIITLTVHIGFMDPLNRPKLFALCIFGLILTVLSLFSRIELETKRFLIPAVLIIAAVTAFILSSFFSGINFNASLMGSRGRQLGSLTYLLFLLFFCLTLLFWSRKAVRLFLVVFAILAGVQICYGLIQNSNKDFIDWNNPYSPIIQTFGNPNFASAFNGLGVIILLRVGWLWRQSWFVLGACFVLAISGVFLIITSSSSQGIFVVLGISLTVMTKFFYDCKNRLGTLFVILCIIFGTLGLLGTLNKGPLAQFIYQGSISARGDYWRAAIRMFLSDPLTGVGLDNFGSYYGENRDLIQVTNRGYATVSDNAHNVFLQLAATGGLLVLIPYVSIILFVTYCAVRVLLKTNWRDGADLTFIVGAWFSILLVSFISIDNIGFSIWQWIIAGIIVRCYADFGQKKSTLPPMKGNRFISGSVGLLCLTLCLVVYKFLIPSAQAELTLKSSLGEVYETDSESLVREKFSMISAIAPADQSIISQLASISSQKRHPELAILYSRKGLDLNPRNLDLLKFEGIALDDLRQYREASRVRLEIKKLDPYNLNNLALLAQNYVLLKEKESAEEVLSEMRSIDSSSEFIEIITKMINQSSFTD